MRQQVVRLDRQQYFLSCHQRRESCCCSGLLACCRCCCFYCCCSAAARLSVADRCMAVDDHCLAVVLGVRVCLLCVPCLLRYLYRACTYREANLEQRQTTSTTTEGFSHAKCYILPAMHGSEKRRHAFKPKTELHF